LHVLLCRSMCRPLLAGADGPEFSDGCRQARLPAHDGAR
jgi:hypothetical protein